MIEKGKDGRLSTAGVGYAHCRTGTAVEQAIITSGVQLALGHDAPSTLPGDHNMIEHTNADQFSHFG